MFTRELKPVTLTNGGETWQLRDPVHVAAFLAKGWKIVKPEEAEPVVDKPARKTKAKE